MPTTRLNTRGGRATGALVLALAGALVGPAAAAQAGVVSFGAGESASSARFFGNPGEVNTVQVTGDATGVTVTDTSTVVSAGAGCHRSDPNIPPASTHSISCTGAVTRLELNGADLNDEITNSTSLPSAISGGDGVDTLVGGSGDDVITTRGLYSDRVRCGAGNDTVNADTGDVIDADCETVSRPGTGTTTPGGGGQTGGASSPPPAVVVPLPAAGACLATRQGTENGDVIAGTAAGDFLLGLGGDDRIQGLAGDDCLFGGNGRDRLSGGQGADYASGEAAADRISGGEGRDRLDGGAGADRISGGNAADTIAGGAGPDRISGGSGVDRINGGAGGDVISGGSGRDNIAGAQGRDRINVSRGSLDRVRCGSGRDVVRADRRDRVARDCEIVTRVR
jgi:Ca2+-binding RTX toxin-like protein